MYYFSANVASAWATVAVPNLLSTEPKSVKYLPYSAFTYFLHANIYMS